jgi:AhpD family alkylhydroperoxidase
VTERAESRAELNEFNDDLSTFVDDAPDLKRFLSFVETAESDGALDHRTKELVSLAVGVAVRCDPCILWHTDAALEAGATPEEVTEALSVAVVMGGGPALAYAARAYRVQQEFRE